MHSIAMPSVGSASGIVGFGRIRFVVQNSNFETSFAPNLVYELVKYS